MAFNFSGMNIRPLTEDELNKVDLKKMETFEHLEETAVSENTQKVNTRKSRRDWER